jgi:hypothetical protein
MYDWGIRQPHPFVLLIYCTVLDLILVLYFFVP